MRVVAARVTEASVVVDGETVGAIEEPGLLLLVGVTHRDTADTARAMAAKVHELRILRDEQSCATAGAPLLVVSQFTLYARTDKGRRPGWTDAAPGPVAEPLVDALIERTPPPRSSGADRPIRRHHGRDQHQRWSVHHHP